MSRTISGTEEEECSHIDPQNVVKVMKCFKDLISMFRLFVALRMYGYIDPLVNAYDPSVIESTLAQAQRDYLSFLSSAQTRKVSLKGNTVDLPCLKILNYKADDPWVKANKDIIYPISENEVCVTTCKYKEEKKSVYVPNPSQKEISNFLNEVKNGNVELAKTVGMLALARRW